MPKRTLNLEPLSFRIATVIAGAIVATILLLASTWFLGDAIAGSATIPELVDLSKSMSPGNPKPYLVSSGMSEESFRDADLKAALDDAGIAVSLSSYDYMSWQRLARLRERSGDIEGAEKALRKALELAPNYAAVQWALGNLLLRRDENVEAFQWIRSSVERDRKYAGPAASIAWDIFEGDIAKVNNAIGNSAHVKVALAVNLSKQKRYEEALGIWKSIPQNERKSTYLVEGKAVLSQLVAAKRFLSALEVAKDIQTDGGPPPRPGRVTNSGFETQVGKEKPGFFEWLIVKGDVPSIGVSVEEKLSGTKSLAVFFNNIRKNVFRSVSQTIALKGGESYTLSVNYKSELKTDATVEWQIADTAGAGILASTDPIQAKSDWSRVDASFSVPEGSEGVILKLVRAECARLSCPINGSVWFDDIEVK